MKKDERGFQKAYINTEKCVNCGRCTKVCQQKGNRKLPSVAIFAARLKDPKDVSSSSSGGIFQALRNWVISQNGFVSGAVYDTNDWHVKHIMTGDKVTTDLMRGSKYVQSDLSDIYLQVKRVLEEGRIVLFTGTPCQVDGLQCFLDTAKVDYNNLYTCELICNGVSSPSLWERYIREFVGEKNIEYISFRHKSPAYRGSILAIGKKNRRCLDLRGYYSKLYTSHLCLSEACYNCRYARTERCADVTIGDFNGTVQGKVTLAAENGLNVVMVNSSKGRKLWQKILPQIDYQDVTDMAYRQDRLHGSVIMPTGRDAFWSNEKIMSMRNILKKYAGRTWADDLRAWKLACRVKRSDHGE